MELGLELQDEQRTVIPPGGGGGLAAFLSFASMRGFGAQHPLIALADRLHSAMGVAMGPLTTFYDASIEDSEDAEKLDRAWQEPVPLAEALAQLAAALQTDGLCATFERRAGTPGLAEDAESLLGPLACAAAAGSKVRLVYRL